MIRPRNASTVVLLRPGNNDGFEVLLTRRPPQMRFLGGYYVFPGGTVHQDDYSGKVLERCRFLAADDARKILSSGLDAEQALGHWVAVARELFEEVGVLLCVNEAEDDINLVDQAAKTRNRARASSDREKRAGFWFIPRIREPFLRSLSGDLLRSLGDAGNLFNALRHALLHSQVAAEPNAAHLFRRSDRQFVGCATRGVVTNSSARSSAPAANPTTVLAELAEIESWDELRSQYRLPK
jgi:8-oxo-dGTP pyrophosphatase MutT (NUDIX family)